MFTIKMCASAPIWFQSLCLRFSRLDSFRWSSSTLYREEEEEESLVL